MPRRQIQEMPIYFQQRGRGEPLLLIHCGLGTGGDFATMLPALAEHYAVITPDRPGYGRSGHGLTFDGDFFARQARWMHQLLDTLALGPAHVWGWSDGAVVALWMAILHPETARSVVVEAGHLYGRKASRTFIERHLEPETLPQEEQARLARQQGAAYWPTLSRRWAQMWLRLDARGGTLYGGRLAEVQTPTLILHADDDAHIPVEEARGLQHRIPGARLQLFPGGGHALHVGPAREAVLAAVLAFLEQSGDGKGGGA